MADWMIWAILAGTLVILELFSGTFYLLMIAIGLVAGALVAYAGGLLEIQLIVAAVVGMLATIILRRSKLGKTLRPDAGHDPGINLDIGQSISVDTWSSDSQAGSSPTARVMYRGALWDVELAKGAEPGPGRFVIREVQGSRLIVGNPF